VIGLLKICLKVTPKPLSVSKGCGLTYLAAFRSRPAEPGSAKG
jgi:hypothetical protein